MYTLSTCGHCKAAKKFMTDHGVAYTCKDVDLLTGDERKATIEEVKKYNPVMQFPHYSDRREGHRRIQRTRHPGGAGYMTAVEQLYETLKRFRSRKDIFSTGTGKRYPISWPDSSPTVNDTGTCAVPAGLHPETGSRTGISSVPAITGRRTSASTAVVTAISMFRRLERREETAVYVPERRPPEKMNF